MPDRSGDLRRAELESADESVLSPQSVLDELAFLASVEHALCIEYLLIHCALGHELPPADTGESAKRVSAAAASASALAQGEMSQLHGVNRVLSAAGRSPEVGRASSIARDQTSDIVLVPPSPAETERFLDRAHAIASAVDERYARLRPAVASPDPLFEGTVLEQMTFILDPGPDHVTPLAELGKHLDGLAPYEYLRARRLDPGDALERRLLRLSDAYYGLIVATIEAWFAHEEQLGGLLRGRAITLMDELDEINRFLAERGLLPAFTRMRCAP